MQEWSQVAYPLVKQLFFCIMGFVVCVCISASYQCAMKKKMGIWIWHLCSRPVAQYVDCISSVGRSSHKELAYHPSPLQHLALWHTAQSIWDLGLLHSRPDLLKIVLKVACKPKKCRHPCSRPTHLHQRKRLYGSILSGLEALDTESKENKVKFPFILKTWKFPATNQRQDPTITPHLVSMAHKTSRILLKLGDNQGGPLGTPTYTCNPESMLGSACTGPSEFRVLSSVHFNQSRNCRFPGTDLSTHTSFYLIAFSSLSLLDCGPTLLLPQPPLSIFPFDSPSKRVFFCISHKVNPPHPMSLLTFYISKMT